MLISKPRQTLLKMVREAKIMPKAQKPKYLSKGMIVNLITCWFGKHFWISEHSDYLQELQQPQM